MSVGVVSCAGVKCKDTVEYPSALPMATVRTLVKQAGWAFRGTVTGWKWFCPVHDPNSGTV
jgi:hypothetical protein